MLWLRLFDSMRTIVSILLYTGTYNALILRLLQTVPNFQVRRTPIIVAMVPIIAAMSPIIAIRAKIAPNTIPTICPAPRPSADLFSNVCEIGAPCTKRKKRTSLKSLCGESMVAPIIRIWRFPTSANSARPASRNGSQSPHPTQINSLNDEARDFRAALTKLAPKEQAQTVREHGRSVELNEVVSRREGKEGMGEYKYAPVSLMSYPVASGAIHGARLTLQYRYLQGSALVPNETLKITRKLGVLCDST